MTFLYSSSVYSCHLFLISYVSVRSLLFLFFIMPIFAWNVPFVAPIFLKRSLAFPILLLSFTSLHCFLKKASSPLLASLWNSAFSWLYLFLSPLLFPSLSSAVCKASSDNHFAFLHFFFLWDGFGHCLLYISWTSVHSSSGALSTRSNPFNLFVTSTVFAVSPPGCLLWPVHSLDKTLLAFDLLHFVLQGQVWLILQISLDFLLLHSNPLWWKEHCFCC